MAIRKKASTLYSVGLHGEAPCIENLTFTVRQSEVLFYILRGKTVKQIARILEISPRTVDEYLAQLRIKFSVQTKHQLIDKAITSGFFHMQPESLSFG